MWNETSESPLVIHYKKWFPKTHYYYLFKKTKKPQNNAQWLYEIIDALTSYKINLLKTSVTLYRLGKVLREMDHITRLELCWFGVDSADYDFSI